MLLAIDIGNTNIVAGVFAGDALVAHWRMATDARRMPDEYAVLLDSLFRLGDLKTSGIRGAIVCSVVPSVQETLCVALQMHWGLDPLIVSLDLDLGVEICYEPREAVGADRIANAVATLHRYGAPAIVVDFGTATTLDAISRDGVYVGGSIAPGLKVSEEALYRHTARLPRAPLEAPRAAVGKSTTTSLQSGILYGYAALVDGLVERFRDELGQEAHVIATGGLADAVVPHTRTVARTDPDLTLLGLHLLYLRNGRQRHG
jgi:type III pantothenate kinase